MSVWLCVRMALACCAWPLHAKDGRVWVAVKDTPIWGTMSEVEAVGVPEKQWYEATVSREGWSAKYWGLQNDPGEWEQEEPSQQPHQVKCLTCNRCFRFGIHTSKRKLPACYTIFWLNTFNHHCVFVHMCECLCGFVCMCVHESACVLVHACSFCV